MIAASYITAGWRVACSFIRGPAIRLGMLHPSLHILSFVALLPTVHKSLSQRASQSGNFILD